MLRHMPTSPSEAPVTDRHAALFRNGRNQAVRIPREFEMEGSEVLIRKDGDSLVLTPVRRNKLRDLLASWEPLDAVLPEVEDPPPQPRDSL
jgi:antitoxin VapB